MLRLLKRLTMNILKIKAMFIIMGKKLTMLILKLLRKLMMQAFFTLTKEMYSLKDRK